MPTEIDFARLAAFIDGEGCIDIHTHRAFMKHLGRVFETQYVRIQITNTDFRLALWCKETFGGTAHPEPPKSERHKAKLNWYCSSKKAAEILIACLPYFVMKRDQAEIALAFQKTKSRIGRRGHTPETFERRLDLQKQIKSLKHVRGDLSTLVH
jgi:hypothetical protein